MYSQRSFFLLRGLLWLSFLCSVGEAIPNQFINLDSILTILRSYLHCKSSMGIELRQLFFLLETGQQGKVAIISLNLPLAHLLLCFLLDHYLINKNLLDCFEFRFRNLLLKTWCESNADYSKIIQKKNNHIQEEGIKRPGQVWSQAKGKQGSRHPMPPSVTKTEGNCR